MRNLFRKKQLVIDSEMLNFEKKLGMVFRPVEPRKEFVSGLRMRLMKHEVQPAATVVPQWVKNPYVIAGGVVGGLVILFTGIRAIISITGGIGILFYHMNQKSKDQPSVASVIQTSN